MQTGAQTSPTHFHAHLEHSSGRALNYITLGQPLEVDHTANHHTDHILSMDTIPEQHRFQAQMALRRHLQQYAVLFLSIILTATAAVLQSLKTREPYHTSILTGDG